MKALPPPKPFHPGFYDGQFVEALRRPASEPDWNLSHEALRVDEHLPSFAINEASYRCRLGDVVIFYYEVPFVLPICVRL